MRWLAGVAVTVAATGAACSSEPLCCFDQFPIAVDMANGVPVVAGCAPELPAGCPAAGLTMVIDTATPITVIDQGMAGERHRVTLEIATSGPTGLVPRARFDNVLALESMVSAVGLAGSPPGPRAIDGVIGGDVLAKLAVRIDASNSRLFFFPDIAGSDDSHAASCEAVIRAAPAGGGEYVLDGTDIVSFPATRLTLGTCLNPDAPSASPLGRGADVLLLIATGTENTVLTRSAFLRAAAAAGTPLTDADLDDDAVFPPDSLFLPGSATATPVRRGTLNRLAVTGDEAGDRGPCRELLGSRRMAMSGCEIGQPCHCSESQLECAAGASLELPGPIPVVIVADTDPAIQIIRDELRPAVADVDGLLGMNVLRTLIVDLDYPHGRVLLRCANATDPTCLLRPRIPNLDTRQNLVDFGCLPP